MAPFKVLLVTTSYPLSEEEMSGIFIRRMVRCLPAGMEVEVLTPAGPGRRGRLAVDGRAVTAFRYAPRRWEVLAHGGGGIPASLLECRLRYLLLPPFLAAEFLNILLRARGADVIHANWAVNGLLAGAAGRMLGVPVITTLRGEDVNRARHSRVSRWVLGLCLALSTRAVTVSEAFRDWIAASFPGRAGGVTVIENGVDEAFLAAGEGRRYDTGDRPLRAMMVGSLIPRKRVEVALEAMELLQGRFPLRLSIVGAGPDEGRLRELARRGGLDEAVSFAGAVRPGLLAGLLRECDLFLLTSRAEGRPNALLEAMAAGLPVIASRIEGVSEIVADGRTGLLFEEGCAPGLAGRLAEAAASAALREDLGRRARSWIIERGLVWENTARGYALLYREVSSGGPAA